MPEISDANAAHLRGLGFTEELIEELRTTGSASMQQGTSSINAFASDDGKLAVTETSGTTSGGIPEFRDGLVFAETMIGQDIDGDGVVGLPATFKTDHDETTTTHPIAHPETHSTANMSPLSSDEPEGSSLGSLAVFLLPILAVAGTAGYLLSDRL